MDLSKAFDSLNYNILLQKLTYYGIRNSAITLLKSYLSNRKQYVQIDDVSSSMLSIYTGVPQGSIVGPLLFNILINDIIMSSDKFSFILCADDTTLNAMVESFGETAADIQISIRNELQKICKWLDLNKLHLNVAKSKFMFFQMPQKIIPQLHFYLNGSPIDYVTEFNFLGLTLDCNLNFKSHLKIIGTKISRVIGLQDGKKTGFFVINRKNPVFMVFMVFSVFVYFFEKELIYAL